MTLPVEQRQNIIAESTAQALSRARDARGLQPEDLNARVAAAVEKYLLRDDPEASRQAIRQFIETLQIDDLCLVVACERGDNAAWQYLFENFGATVRSAARSVTSNQDAAEDLAQSIWAELHGLKTNASGKPSGKLGYYSGRGSLAGWLRAVVSQLAVDAHRKQSRLVQIEESREFENLAHDAAKNDNNFIAHQKNENPEEAFTTRELARDVQAALNKAIQQLDAEDKILMKLYYFDGLKLKQAGAVLGFHEATASRRLTRIHTEVRKSIERILQTENGWSREEIAAALAEAAENLDANVEKFLSSEPSVQEN